MEIHEGRFRFTLRDMLVLFVVVALLLGLLTPLIQEAREHARAAQCASNMKLLGLAFHNYAYNFNKHFPASAGVTRGADGSIRAVDGWSFLVYLLPYECDHVLYETLDVQHGKPLGEPAGARGTPHADAANERQSYLICPSNRNPMHVPGCGWMTNYKAMGATHVESLLAASPAPAAPLYLPDDKAAHPDGACFPGKDVALKDFTDGLSQTVLAVETMDPAYGIWTVGAECMLVGLPSRQPNAQGEEEPLRIEWCEAKACYAPAGFDGKHYDEASPEVQRLKTYLAYDFRRADPGPYAGADPRNAYGPSSAHPGGVHHLFADGSVRNMRRNMDFALYMFLLTRNGGDPAGCSCDWH